MVTTTRTVAKAESDGNWMSKIVVFNQDNWTLEKSNKFKTRDYPTIVSRGIKEGVIAWSEGQKLLKVYNESKERFKLPPEWSIESSNGGEYVLSLDGSDKPNKTWYSRYKENLIGIAHERVYKEYVKEK